MKRLWSELLLAWVLLAPTSAAAEVLVLDAQGDRALVGTPLPAPEAADPAFRMRVRLERGGQAVRTSLDAQDWSFARLLPGDRFLGVTPDRRLVIGPLGKGKLRVVDTGVEGAVAASPDGRHLAYCKGLAPVLEVFRADDGRVTAVTSGFSPAWSPAISADGQVVAFVSARSGVPAIYRVQGGAAPVQLTNVGLRPQPGVVPTLAPFPDGMTAPLVSASHLVFESGGAVHVLDAAGRPLRMLPGLGAPYWQEPGRRAGAFRPGRTSPEVIELPAAGRSP